MYYLIGGSGSPNYGDELIMQQWLRFLDEEVLPHRPGARVVVDNNSAEGSRALFGSLHPHVDFTSKLKRLQPDRAKGSFMKNLAYGLGFFSRGHWRQHPELADAVAKMEASRLVHLYGGGYINTLLWPGSAFLIGLLADAAAQFKLSVVATGVGITPLQFEANEDLGPLQRALQAFSVFEVRDSYGFNRLRQLVGESPALLCGHDDAFLYPIERQPGSAGRRRLHLSAYRSGNLFERPDVQRWLQRHASDFDECVYWECAPRMEQEIIAPLQRVLPKMRLCGVEELLFRGVPANPDDHMLTMRYHPHLVASRLGVSGQFLAASTYYEHKHGAVVHLGSRFTRLRDECDPPAPLSQPLAWREPGWTALKRELARQVYGLP